MTDVATTGFSLVTSPLTLIVSEFPEFSLFSPFDFSPSVTLSPAVRTTVPGSSKDSDVTGTSSFLFLIEIISPRLPV